MKQVDIVIAGGGFAGLACAKAAAERGLSVTVLERKKAAGIGLHTTGIMVKEATTGLGVPEHLTRRITDVRLYAPNLKHTELHSSDYFFLATDTPGLMRHLDDDLGVRRGARRGVRDRRRRPGPRRSRWDR
jgi:flavin-dependent dehydrogenase